MMRESGLCDLLGGRAVVTRAKSDTGWHILLGNRGY